MIDFHTHILPGIDDGSQDMDETRLLLGQEAQQGVSQVLATPHFYAGRDTAEHFFHKRERALAAVREAFAGQTVPDGQMTGKSQVPDKRTAAETRVPEIRAAAEVYYFPHMGDADILPRLCMEGSSLLLVEMPFVQWTKAVYQDVEKIIEKQKLTVVLAHVERYYGFQKDRGVWDAIFDLPLYAQINAGSLLRMRTRGFGLKFLKAGHAALLGSDCHNPEYRPVNLEAGREVVRKKLGEGTLKEIDRLGEELWEHA